MRRGPSGYGFLAEDPLFAEGCSDAGIRFIGPSPDNLRLSGDKVSARNAAAQAGVPIAAGAPPIEGVDLALTTARDIGFPVMIKAAKGGGGKGMRVVTDEDSLRREFPMASTEAAAAFGDGAVYLERFVGRARHVEVQVVGSPSGEAIHLGDRDCTVQRQNQKLIEEAPAPFIPPVMQERALSQLHVEGVDTTADLARSIVGSAEFSRLDLSTRWLGDLLARGRWPGDDRGSQEFVSPGRRPVTGDRVSGARPVSSDPSQASGLETGAEATRCPA